MVHDIVNEKSVVSQQVMAERCPCLNVWKSAFVWGEGACVIGGRCLRIPVRGLSVQGTCLGGRLSGRRPGPRWESFSAFPDATVAVTVALASRLVFALRAWKPPYGNDRSRMHMALVTAAQITDSVTHCSQPWKLSRRRDCVCAATRQFTTRCFASSSVTSQRPNMFDLGLV